MVHYKHDDYAKLCKIRSVRTYIYKRICLLAQFEFKLCTFVRCIKYKVLIRRRDSSARQTVSLISLPCGKDVST